MNQNIETPNVPVNNVAVMDRPAVSPVEPVAVEPDAKDITELAALAAEVSRLTALSNGLDAAKKDFDQRIETLGAEILSRIGTANSLDVGDFTVTRSVVRKLDIKKMLEVFPRAQNPDLYKVTVSSTLAEFEKFTKMRSGETPLPDITGIIVQSSEKAKVTPAPELKAAPESTRKTTTVKA